MSRLEIARRQGIALLIDAINQQQTAYPVIDLGMLRPWLKEYRTDVSQVYAECRTCHSEEVWAVSLDHLFEGLVENWFNIGTFTAFMQDGICGHCKESIK